MNRLASSSATVTRSLAEAFSRTFSASRARKCGMIFFCRVTEKFGKVLSGHNFDEKQALCRNAVTRRSATAEMNWLRRALSCQFVVIVRPSDHFNTWVFSSFRALRSLHLNRRESHGKHQCIAYCLP
jgi:hypothetical protein